jgi:Fe-S cluster biogenesis protein NfuA
LWVSRRKTKAGRQATILSFILKEIAPALQKHGGDTLSRVFGRRKAASTDVLRSLMYSEAGT